MLAGELGGDPRRVDPAAQVAAVGHVDVDGALHGRAERAIERVHRGVEVDPLGCQTQRRPSPNARLRRRDVERERAAGLETAHVREERVVTERVIEAQHLPEGGVIDPAIDASPADEGLRFAREQHDAIGAARPHERLDAGAITHRQHATATGVVEDEREHSLEPFERGLAVQSQHVQQHLGVARGPEDDAVLGLQLAAQLPVVDDRAREHEVRVLERHRLVRLGPRVDHAEARMTERHRAEDDVRLVIRPAMRERGRETLRELVEPIMRESGRDDPDDSAHGPMPPLLRSA